MDQRLDLLTLGVPDLDAARRFYLDGLGWEAALDVPGEVVFLRVGHSRMLALFGADDLAADMGVPAGAPGGGVTLGHMVDSPEAVEAVIQRAEAAGATVLKPAQRAFWGGHHGYFADPAGFVWEIAHNPGFRVDEDGNAHIGAVP
jgi:catechol 2,3-dioxygenase-like lactoylglutathione lyase family enzyme